MESIARGRRKWKRKVVELRKRIKTMQGMVGIDDIDVKVSLIQALIPIGLNSVCEELQREVLKLSGPKSRHGKENVRWGKQWGSIYLLDQKVPVEVPRVRNKLRDVEIPLQVYQRLQQPYQGDEQVFKKLINGLSMHRYEESAQLVPEVFGLSASNMSRRFKTATATQLRKLMTRRLGRYDCVAIFVDGKRFADEGIVIAVGITIEGEKVILGLAQMNTENYRAVEQFFDNLLKRGLRFEEGVLFIVDGSRGIIKGIERKFKGYQLIQRCQFHKRENVISHLSKGQQTVWRRKLQMAYAQESYEGAKGALMKLLRELEEINPTAANSLQEGMEESLTIYKLDIPMELRKTFSTTNCIESILAQVEQYTQRVDRWRNGAHIQRWVAAGLIEVEPRLRKVNGWRKLSLLRKKIKEELRRKSGEENDFLCEHELIRGGV